MDNLFPRELRPNNFESINATRRNSELGQLFHNMSSHIETLAFSQSMHAQTAWPFALGIPSSTDMHYAMYPCHTGSEFDNIIAAFEDCTQTRHQLLFVHDRCKIDLDTHRCLRDYERLPNIETMLTITKRSSVRVLKHKQAPSIVVVVPSLEYEILIRLALLLPGLWGFSLPEPMQEILIVWLEYAKQKITEAQFQTYLLDSVTFRDIIAATRRAKLTALVTEYYTQQRQGLSRTVSQYLEKLANLLGMYSANVQLLETAQRTLIGYETNSSAEQQELQTFVDTLINNPQIKDIRINGSQLGCTFSVPGNNIDLDIFETYKRTRYSHDPVTLRIIDKLFFSGKYQLWLQAGVILPLPGQALSSDPSAGYNPEHGLPNYHIKAYDCFGSNSMTIVKAAKEGNYMYMLSAIVASVMNINLMDSTVWSKFAQAILQGGDTLYHAIEDKTTGKRITCYHFFCDTVKELEAEDAQQRAQQDAENAGQPDQQGQGTAPDQPDTRRTDGDGAPPVAVEDLFPVEEVFPFDENEDIDNIRAEEVDDETN